MQITDYSELLDKYGILYAEDNEAEDYVRGSIATLNRALVGMPIIAKGRISLRPLIMELKVLTKARGIARLGDIIKPPQELLLHTIEKQLNNGGSVRIIILKARQMGLSTMVEAVIFVLSMLYTDFQSLIISHEGESSEHILTMTKRYWSTYVFGDYHDEQYAAKKQLSWSDNGSNIVVATAKNQAAGRSKTLHALHASEVGFWDNPDILMTGLRQAIPNMGITLIILESTANGIGNYYHNTWQDAEAGDSEFEPVFYPWFLDPEYDAPGIPMREAGKYTQLGKLDEEELILRSMGVSDSRLLWRRWAFVALCGRSWDKFKQEYPSTPHEAFLSTGRNVFRLQDLLAHYEPMTPDVGILYRNGRNEVTFQKDPKGWLRVYRYPANDKNWGVYLLGADPTHTTVGDNACGQVFNRRTMEQCATYSRHQDAVSLADDLYLLGEWYNYAEIAPETTGPGFGTTGKLSGLGYPRIYQRIKSDNEDDTGGSLLGWITNVQTKHQAIGWLINLFGQSLSTINGVVYGIVIHDEETFREMRDYVTDEKGGYKNGKGQPFDDTVMAAGIAAAVNSQLPPVLPYSPDTSMADRAQNVVALLPRPLQPQTGAVATKDRPDAPSSLASAPYTNSGPMQVDPRIKETEEFTPDFYTWEDRDA